MLTMTINRSVRAPVDKVFRTVAEPQEFAKAIPEITNMEFLGETKVGVGTKFVETRTMKGKEMKTALEVTEYEENNRVRMVTESHGTVWDSVYTVRANGPSTVLTLFMEARTGNILAKVMMTLMWGRITRSVEANMDMVKAHCEK